MNAWEKVKHQLQSKLNHDAYRNWVARTTLLTANARSLEISVPDDATRECMETDYAMAVDTALRELMLPFSSVVYVVATERWNSRAAASNEADLPLHGPATEPLATDRLQLNEKFTFDTFVVGSCNQFAHAAAQAVANRPSRSYNPLFIYGGVGMGKTHLMHAIGRSLSEKHGGMRIVYTASEKFINLMIQCIRTDRMPHFHRHFRSADVLLIDDIQFIAGKERTQEEFFYTFNELHENQKQIVVSSDAHPKQMPNLVERLRSRFEWGLMVDVQPPDLETKMAILDKKAEQEGVVLPEDVRIYIATRTKSNVRELEGALVKLIAYSSVSGSPITKQMADNVLRHMVQSNGRKVTIDAVIRAVAERYGLQPAQLKMKTNAWNISYPRQVAMYVAKEVTGASLPEIGRAFGGKHHTTVLHSVQKIDQLRQSDVDLNRTVHSLIDSMN